MDDSELERRRNRSGMIGAAIGILMIAVAVASTWLPEWIRESVFDFMDEWMWRGFIPLMGAIIFGMWGYRIGHSFPEKSDD